MSRANAPQQTPPPERAQPTGWLRACRYYGLRYLRFVRIDLWRIPPSELRQPFRLISATLQVLYVTIRRFVVDDLYSRAASLTYSTMLSIVPMLAVIVGIAKGFGLQALVHDALAGLFPAQSKEIDQAFVYVENYLQEVRGGLFVGLGLGVLLYTVLMLMASIEDTFNFIWQAPHARAWRRRIFDYLGSFILLPMMMTASSLLTLLRSSLRGVVDMDGVSLLAPMLSGVMQLTPFVIAICIFTGLYMILPSVRVRLAPALISGTVAGVTFQAFQMLYISGVLWISRYNAIYGSFAVFPLMLLWIQFSWVIVLLGAQLSYAIQSLPSFVFGEASEQASRRYQDFVHIIIMSRIVQRFAREGAQPYDAEELSRACRIPLRLVTGTLSRLSQAGLITEVGTASEGYYQPALDTERLTVGYLLDRLDRYGEEDFRIDRTRRFRPEWEAMLASRAEGLEAQRALHLRDLGIIC